MQKNSSMIGGLILIAAGILFLALQMAPGLAEQFNMARQWPLIVVAVGACFLLGALLGTPPLAVSGSVIGGVGLLLYYQNLTGRWDSWAYAWTLFPGFSGAGIFLMRLLQRRPAEALREGGRLMVISLALFVIFGSFLGGWLRWELVWPVALIVLGLWLLFRNRPGGRSPVQKEPEG